MLSSVQFSCSVMYDSLWPHGLWHTRLPYPLPTPRAYSNSCPLSWWCHPPSYPLSSPSPPAFNLSQHQGIFQWVSSLHQVAKMLVSASTPVLSMSIQDWFPLRLTGWISLWSKGLSRVFSNTTVQNNQLLGAQHFFIVQLSHPYMTTGKTIALTGWTFVGKIMSLLINILSSLVITFLPRSKHLLISQLQSPSAVILEPPKIKSLTVSIVSPSICHEMMGPDAMILVF